MLQEAMSKEDWEMLEKGIRPKKKARTPRPEPAKPIIENEVKVSDIPEGYSLKLEQAFKKVIQNVDGIRFIGYEVLIELTPIPKKRGPGRPKEDEVAPEPKTLMGWMIEGEFLALNRKFRKEIDQQVIRW